MANDFFDVLKLKMDEYAHLIYKLSKDFPRDEIYGVTSQIRRAALSVILNFIEGFARKKLGFKLNFFQISYGSLKESKYLLHFCMKEKYLSMEDYKKAVVLSEEIGAMLWKVIESLEK